MTPVHEEVGVGNETAGAQTSGQREYSACIAAREAENRKSACGGEEWEAKGDRAQLPLAHAIVFIIKEGPPRWQSTGRRRTGIGPRAGSSYSRVQIAAQLAHAYA